MTNAGPAGAVLTLVLMGAACSPPKGTLASDLPPPVPPGDPNAVEAQEETSAADDSAAEVPDAVAAAPEQFRILAASDAARLLLAVWEPGATAPTHAHPEHVIYALTDGRWSVEGADGDPSEQSLVAGDVRENAPVASHAVANPGDEPMRLLILERLGGEPEVAPAGAAADAPSASSDVFEVIADGEWVRVVKATWKRGVADAMHSHPAHLAYVLTDGRLEVEGKGGDKQAVEASAGTALAQGAVAGHSVANVGDSDVEMLLFELKRTRPAERSAF